MPNLLPTGYEEEVLEADDLVANQPIGYRNGIAFDDSIGDFRRDGKNRLLDSTGIESWKSWCINCLQTERFKHLAYSSDFGIEMDAVFAATSREEAESILTRQITEAIMADPYQRAAYIENLEYAWAAADAVEVHLTIQGIDDVSIDITAYITKNDLVVPSVPEETDRYAILADSAGVRLTTADEKHLVVKI